MSRMLFICWHNWLLFLRQQHIFRKQQGSCFLLAGAIRLYLQGRRKYFDDSRWPLSIGEKLHEFVSKFIMFICKQERCFLKIRSMCCWESLQCGFVYLFSFCYFFYSLAFLLFSEPFLTISSCSHSCSPFLEFWDTVCCADQTLDFSWREFNSVQYFVNTNICRCQYFVDASILSTAKNSVDGSILSAPIFCRRQCFVTANILTPPIFCRRQYFVAANSFNCV